MNDLKNHIKLDCAKTLFLSPTEKKKNYSFLYCILRDKEISNSSADNREFAVR